MTNVISVENISKSYRLGQIGSGTFAHDLNLWWAKVRGKPNPLQRIGTQDHNHHNGGEFWALQDVSFKVKQGEVLGIVGRNGAGKSTLLKILSRVTAPTSGRVKVKGRIASLLEVGSGFHPDLSGRENIYLNGAVLGMDRREITRKFNEIVDFAEVEKFIDTPVKRYSSGMYVRLAFAVAAHLEPEILVVDEVLAVGDVEFQKKCLGKMGDVAKEGRTVLFVSHNMGVIAQLCRQGMLLEHGRLILIDDIQPVISRYLNSGAINGIFDTSELTQRSGQGGGKITQVEFTGPGGERSATFGVGQPFRILIHAHLTEELTSLVAGVEIKSSLGTPILNIRSDGQGLAFGPFPKGSEVVIQIDLPGLPLYPGVYMIEPWFAQKQGQRCDHIYQGLTFELELAGVYRSEMFIQASRGIMLVDCDWAATTK
jgi:lipopolysaccharide transport system ATP-binding protein